MYFKFKMNHAGNGRLYNFVIVEAEGEEDAYERTMHLPMLFGAADEEAFAEMVTNPLNEPWPIFTDAFFSREFADDEAR